MTCSPSSKPLTRNFGRHVGAGDADEMHRHLARDNNARNVDAHPAVYTLLHAFPEMRAELQHYAQAYSPDQNIMVSFAALKLPILMTFIQNANYRTHLETIIAYL